MKRLIIAAALSLAVAGCGRTIATDRPVYVKVPVAQKCVGPAPARPATLEAKTPDWKGMDIRQRVAAVSAWALEWVGYGEKLEVAVAGCPKE